MTRPRHRLGSCSWPAGNKGIAGCNVPLDVPGHFGDNLPSQSVDSCKKPLFRTNHLAGTKVKVKEDHTPKEHRRGAHLPFISRWARTWINRYCLWRMATATPDLRLPSQPKLVLIVPTHRGMARLSWPGWLVTYRDSLPARRRSPIQALTGPSVE